MAADHVWRQPANAAHDLALLARGQAVVIEYA